MTEWIPYTPEKKGTISKKKESSSSPSILQSTVFRGSNMYSYQWYSMVFKILQTNIIVSEKTYGTPRNIYLPPGKDRWQSPLPLVLVYHGHLRIPYLWRSPSILSLWCFVRRPFPCHESVRGLPEPWIRYIVDMHNWCTRQVTFQKWLILEWQEPWIPRIDPPRH